MSQIKLFLKIKIVCLKKIISDLRDACLANFRIVFLFKVCWMNVGGSGRVPGVQVSLEAMSKKHVSPGR